MDQGELQRWLSAKNSEYRRRDIAPKARPFLALSDLSVELQSSILFNSPLANSVFEWFEENTKADAHWIGALAQIDPLRGLLRPLPPEATPLAPRPAIRLQQIKVGSGINGRRPTTWVSTIYSVPLYDFLILNHKIDEKAFRRCCVSQDCNGTVSTLRLPEMIKERIPELQRLSAAEKFALAMSFGTNCLPIPMKFLSPRSS